MHDHLVPMRNFECMITWSLPKTNAWSPCHHHYFWVHDHLVLSMIDNAVSPSPPLYGTYITEDYQTKTLSSDKKPNLKRKRSRKKEIPEWWRVLLVQLESILLTLILMRKINIWSHRVVKCNSDICNSAFNKGYLCNKKVKLLIHPSNHNQ